MDERIGIAVIGLGVIGRRMLEQCARRDDLVVTGAWDIDPQARERAARDFPHIRIATDALSAIADAGARIVYVGTPPAFHREYSLLASAHGRKVFCEKPLAVDVAQGERLVREIESAGTPNAVNFVYASAPAARALAAAIADGAIGKPLLIETRLFFARWPRDWQASAKWLSYRAEGGFIREVLSHFVYLMRDLFGDCTHRASFVDYPGDGKSCERAAVAMLDCAGVPVVVTAGAGGGGPDEVVFTVRGERGALRLDNWYGLQRAEGAGWVDTPVDHRPHPDMRTAAYQAQLDALVQFGLGAPQRLPTMAMALEVQRLIERILQPD
jgi:1,5-anhydro-D-fructose reductase (1,5-anhydro-D-mannitol-forming)